jgi:phosphoribosylaminoimidazole-succinocarboxamide synthase
MIKGKFLYEGKAKQLYETDDPDVVYIHYKDDATAFNALKRGSIKNKGVVNNTLANHFFKALETKGIPTHFIEQLSDRDTLAKKVKIVPVEVIVRNIVAGSMAKRMGLEEGTKLTHPIIEYSYKSDALGDPLMGDDYPTAIGLATSEEMAKIRNFSAKINELLKSALLEAGIKLVDFKLEFGRYKGDIILADEISPDTCRFWDLETNEKLDKDRFRRDLGGVEAAYAEVLKRLMTD